MSTIGERLKNERERLGLNQTQLGAIGGVQKQSQLKYENGVTSPTASYLAEVAKIGVDIQYVILGARTSTAINEEELLLLQRFRNADPAVRQFMLGGVMSSTMKIEGSGNKQCKTSSSDVMEIKGNKNIQIASTSKRSK